MSWYGLGMNAMSQGLKDGTHMKDSRVARRCDCTLCCGCWIERNATTVPLDRKVDRRVESGNFMLSCVVWFF